MTNALPLYALHVRSAVVQLLRIPAFAIPTLLSPLMIYSFFGLPYSKSEIAARFLIASYAAFAVIGVALFQFGVGIASERTSSWEIYMRTLAVPVAVRFLARITSALLFATASAGAVCVLGVLAAHVRMPAESWLSLGVSLLAGSVVFALIGITIGYWSDSRAALPVANLVYMPLVFVGGLWLPPQMLPAAVAWLSPFTPTRQYGELVWASVAGHPLPGAAFAVLGAYALVFAVAAAWGYRRDEGLRFR
jgi:ABC-2 type transport system permease protein